jgi:hypothetical protein
MERSGRRCCSISRRRAAVVLWPFLGGTARLIVAAGIGWWAVARWGFGLPTLFFLVAAAIVISATISFVAKLSGAIWRTGRE